MPRRKPKNWVLASHSVPRVIFLVVNMSRPAKNKCSFRSCGKVNQDNPDDVVAYKCSAPGCEKMIHERCCKMIANHYHLTEAADAKSLFCTKACFDEIKKAATGTKMVLWSQDGKEGPNDQTGNSERLLIDWLITGDNYANYCGPKNGESKHSIAFRLSEMLKDKGVTVDRTPRSIEAKISQIEQSFKKAYKWTQQTGVGVKEDDPEGFEKAVLRRCSYFNDLENVMARRSKVKPLCTSDYDLLASDSESDDDLTTTTGSTQSTDKSKSPLSINVPLQPKSQKKWDQEAADFLERL